MTTVYRWIKCSTPGCDSKHSGFYLPDFDFLAKLPEGWTTDPARCPDCNSPQAEPGEDRILVVPLPCGAFTAYAPRTMTPEDWRVVQGICGVMAGQQQRLSVEDMLIPDWNNARSADVTASAVPCSKLPTGSVVVTTPCAGDTTTPSLKDILIRDWNNAGIKGGVPGEAQP